MGNSQTKKLNPSTSTNASTTTTPLKIEGDTLTDAGDSTLAATTVAFAVVAATGITAGAVVTALPVAVGLGLLMMIAGKGLQVSRANKEYNEFCETLLEFLHSIKQNFETLDLDNDSSELGKSCRKYRDLLTAQMSHCNNITKKRVLFFPNSVLEGLHRNLQWMGLYLTLFLQKQISAPSKNSPTLIPLANEQQITEEAQKLSAKSEQELEAKSDELKDKTTEELKSILEETSDSPQNDETEMKIIDDGSSFGIGPDNTQKDDVRNENIMEGGGKGKRNRVTRKRKNRKFQKVVAIYNRLIQKLRKRKRKLKNKKKKYSTKKH
jgi:hypothetical protein